MSVGDFHRRAMEFADLAFVAKLQGDNERALLLFQKAFESEREAAMLVANDLQAEPTRSTLFRSAATLAIDCNQQDEAERLANIALSGNPPGEIADELRGLLEQSRSLRDEPQPFKPSFAEQGHKGKPGLVPRFLRLAVTMRKISEATRTMVLNEQRRRGLLGEHHLRVGEVLVQMGILTEADRDEVLERQKLFTDRSFAIQRDVAAHPTATFGLQTVVALLAIVAVSIATLKYRVTLELAIVVAGFVVYALETILQYRAGRSVLSALRIALPLIILIALSLLLFAGVSIVSLEYAPGGAQLQKIKLAFAAMVTAVAILLLYSVWKFHALRFAQTRLATVKDILIRVETILRNDSDTLEARKRLAMSVVFKGLRNAIRLRPADRILRVLSMFSPSFNQTSVLFFVPDASGKRFELQDAAVPEGVSDQVLEAFEWIKNNHHPVLLNESEFERLKRLAQATSPDWKQAYLNMPERYEYISECGWVFEKQEILSSQSAEKSIALDNSFLRKMEQEGFSEDILRWVEVKSFVGCRIIGKAGKPAGVLLVAKNIPKSFSPEDIEIIVTASMIISRILQSDKDKSMETDTMSLGFTLPLFVMRTTNR